MKRAAGRTHSRAVARYRGLAIYTHAIRTWGLAPQALCFRLLRRLGLSNTVDFFSIRCERLLTNAHSQTRLELRVMHGDFTLTLLNMKRLIDEEQVFAVSNGSRSIKDRVMFASEVTATSRSGGEELRSGDRSHFGD